MVPSSHFAGMTKGRAWRPTTASASDAIADIRRSSHYVSMLSRLRAIRPWIGALRAYWSGDSETALAMAEKSFLLDGRSNNYQLAFYATLLILNHRSRDAAQAFYQAQLARPGRSADPAYVKAYAAYYLELIKKGDRAKELWEFARAQPQSRFTRRYLPLPPVPVP